MICALDRCVSRTRSREVDDRLIRRPAALWQKHQRRDALACVRRLKRYSLDPPLRVRVVERFRLRGEIRAVVCVEPKVGLEPLVRGGLLLTVVARLEGDQFVVGSRQRLVRCVLDEPKSETGRAIERRPRIRIVEHVDRLVPGTAQDVASRRIGAVPAPLLDVAGKIDRTEVVHPTASARLHRAAVGEIAARDDGAAQPLACRTAPVIDRGQRLASERRIGGGFVPAHAAHRIVVLALGISARLPGRGAGSARGVPEQRHRFLEGQAPAILLERYPPVPWVAITAGVNEARESRGSSLRCGRSRSRGA